MTEHITERSKTFDKVLTPVHAYRAEVYCKCGGELQNDGYMYPTYPPMYPHVCNMCGHKENLGSTYPKIEYR
jgi:hypothetical protein